MTGAPPGTSDETKSDTSVLPEKILEPINLPKNIPAKEQPDLGTLENDLPFGAMLYPGTTAYERGAFIGNLLYRLKTPAAIVQPRETADVVKIINFCRTNRVELTVKNGGHSYAGYCLNKGGIVMDMGAMMQVVIADNEATIQGGATWKAVYGKLVGKDQASIIIGGQCPHVGVSGFTLGAGLSPFSRSYGLGIDNVNEMTIVTADGEVVTVTANETDPKRQKLFWALRGGGGGNFGALVEFKTKVHKLNHPQGTVVCGQLTWHLDEHREEYINMMVAFDEKAACEKKGEPQPLTVDAIWRVDGKTGKLVGQMTVIYNGDKANCDKALKHLLDFHPDGNDLKEMPWSEWVHTEEGFDIKDRVFHHHASFIFAQGALDRNLVERITGLIEQAYRRFSLTKKADFHFLWDHIGGKTTAYNGDATAFPWRTGTYVCTFKIQWRDDTLKDEMLDFALKVRLFLDPFTIDKKAAYLNYIDSTVDDWQGAYYGSNYPELQAVKQEWDPKDFFRFDRSIELPHRTRRIAGVRPFPMGAAPRGISWGMPISAPEHIAYGAIPIRSVEHDIAKQTASERTAALWSEYEMPASALEDLKDDDDEELFFAKTGAERVKRMNQEISKIGAAS